MSEDKDKFPTERPIENNLPQKIDEKIDEKPRFTSGVLSCANCSKKSNNANESFHKHNDSRPIVIIEGCGSLITPWGLLPKGYKKNKNFSELLPKNENDEKSLNWFSWMQLFHTNLKKELETLMSRFTYRILPKFMKPKLIDEKLEDILKKAEISIEIKLGMQSCDEVNKNMQKFLGLLINWHRKCSQSMFENLLDRVSQTHVTKVPKGEKPIDTICPVVLDECFKGKLEFKMQHNNKYRKMTESDQKAQDKKLKSKKTHLEVLNENYRSIFLVKPEYQDDNKTIDHVRTLFTLFAVYRAFPTVELVLYDNNQLNSTQQEKGISSYNGCGFQAEKSNQKNMFIASTYPKEFYDEVCKKLLNFPENFSVPKSMVYIGHYRINTDEKNKRCQDVDEMGISMEIATLTQLKNKQDLRQEINKDGRKECIVVGWNGGADRIDWFINKSRFVLDQYPFSFKYFDLACDRDITTKQFDCQFFVSKYVHARRDDKRILKDRFLDLYKKHTKCIFLDGGTVDELNNNRLIMGAEMKNLFAQESIEKEWKKEFYSTVPENQAYPKVTIPKEFSMDPEVQEKDGEKVYKYTKDDFLKKMKENNMNYPVQIKPEDANLHNIFQCVIEDTVEESLKNQWESEKVVVQACCDTNTTFKIYRLLEDTKIESKTCLVRDKALQEKYYGDNLINLCKGKEPKVPLSEFGTLLNSDEYFDKFHWICDQISTHFKCYLFGIDIVVDADTGNYCIVDYNSLPSYGPFPDMRTPWIKFQEKMSKQNYPDKKI